MRITSRGRDSARWVAARERASSTSAAPRHQRKTLALRSDACQWATKRLSSALKGSLEGARVLDEGRRQGSLEHHPLACAAPPATDPAPIKDVGLLESDEIPARAAPNLRCRELRGNRLPQVGHGLLLRLPLVQAGRHAGRSLSSTHCSSAARGCCRKSTSGGPRGSTKGNRGPASESGGLRSRASGFEPMRDPASSM